MDGRADPSPLSAPASIVARRTGRAEERKQDQHEAQADDDVGPGKRDLELGHELAGEQETAAEDEQQAEHDRGGAGTVAPSCPVAPLVAGGRQCRA